MTSLPKMLVEFVKQAAIPIILVVALVVGGFTLRSCSKEDPTPSNYELRIEPDGSFEIVVPQ